jgi:hypothetical protein
VSRPAPDLAAWARRVNDAEARPLTDEQRVRLRALLRPAGRAERAS